MAAAALAAATLVSGCGGDELSETPLAGEYIRGSFHLYLFCAGQDPQYRAEDLLYPLNFPGQTWAFAQDGTDVTMSWDGLPLAQGRRTTNGISLDFERIDPYGDTVDWHFEGKLRDDLAFHGRTVVGRIDSGTHEGCLILPNSVAWFTEGVRERSKPLNPEAAASARGGWGRFVWFLDVGPYGMSRKGDEGQRGRNLRMFSFSATGGGSITAGGDGAFFDNGFGTPWLGAAQNGAVEFEQPEQYWDLEYRQDVLFDDGGDSDLGVHRVLAGFVDGHYRVTEENYPFGWEGETGMLPIKSPGMAFWLDLTRGEQLPEASAAVASPRVVTREEDESVPRSPMIRMIDGVPVW